MFCGLLSSMEWQIFLHFVTGDEMWILYVNSEPNSNQCSGNISVHQNLQNPSKLSLRGKLQQMCFGTKGFKTVCFWFILWSLEPSHPKSILTLFKLCLHHSKPIQGMLRLGIVLLYNNTCLHTASHSWNNSTILRGDFLSFTFIVLDVMLSDYLSSYTSRTFFCSNASRKLNKLTEISGGRISFIWFEKTCFMLSKIFRTNVTI